ncbi:MAG: hypothetical protein RIC19_10275 [Phaeodactylibacter sp.]|uniref:hypothetical protein n=1 Tax=Phaeodactylibacter sp. TaxID=1940289 RepID=UPI0032EB95E1
MRPIRLICFYFTSLLLTGLAASGCQQDAAPEQPATKTYANLFVRYIAPQAQLKVTAAFREGDSLATAKPVELPGGVTYQGQQLEARPLPGQQVRYFADYQSAFMLRHRFQFKSADGQEQEVTLELSPIDSFSVIGGTASLSEGMQLYIKDEQIEEGESIVLLFSDADNKATTITLTNPAVKDTFPVAGIRLRKLEPGPHRVYLVKKQHQEIDLNGVKAIADIEYYTAEQPFTVKE